jgi:exonuclease III
LNKNFINKNKLKEDLILTHWNCNSINNKIEEFKVFLLKYIPDILSLNETKVNEVNANFLFNDIVGYNFVQKHRNNNKNGVGGVALLIQKNRKYTELNILDHLNIETICMKIKIKKLELLIISYYNPPNCILSKEVFELATRSKINFVICGDFNS